MLKVKKNIIISFLTILSAIIISNAAFFLLIHPNLDTTGIDANGVDEYILSAIIILFICVIIILIVYVFISLYDLTHDIYLYKDVVVYCKHQDITTYKSFIYCRKCEKTLKKINYIFNN